MKQLSVPFYGNHEDGMHCMLAVYRSIFDYFLGEKVSWEKMEELTGYKPLKPAWSLQILTYLADKSLDINMVEPFDYAQYAQDGIDYLRSLYSKEELDWQLKNSNILEIKPMIPGFLKIANLECRRPGIKDIEEMLKDERLVFVTLNSMALNGEPGYESHAVLVIGQTNNEFIFHDPGLPPKPYRKELKTKMYEAMGGDKNTSEVSGFKLRSQVNN